MSLPQHDFTKAMCHKAVAKSLAKNIQSALKSSPSVIKETLSTSDLLHPPPYEKVPTDELINLKSESPIAQANTEPRPQPVPQTSRSSGESTSQGNVEQPRQSSGSGASGERQDLEWDEEGGDDIWVLRESFVDKLATDDKVWKSNQLSQEQIENRLQAETRQRSKI